jgi:hypothetical protein
MLVLREPLEAPPRRHLRASARRRGLGLPVTAGSRRGQPAMLPSIQSGATLRRAHRFGTRGPRHAVSVKVAGARLLPSDLNVNRSLRTSPADGMDCAKHGVTARGCTCAAPR